MLSDDEFAALTFLAAELVEALWRRYRSDDQFCLVSAASNIKRCLNASSIIKDNGRSTLLINSIYFKLHFGSSYNAKGGRSSTWHDEAVFDVVPNDSGFAHTPETDLAERFGRGKLRSRARKATLTCVHCRSRRNNFRCRRNVG